MHCADRVLNRFFFSTLLVGAMPSRKFSDDIGET